MRRTPLVILWLVGLGCLLAPARWLRADDKPKGQAAHDERSKAGEVFISAKQLSQLLENEPDTVVLTGDKAKQYLEAAAASERRDRPAVTVQQCAIRGILQNESCLLNVEIAANAEQEGPSPVAIGLADANLIKLEINGHRPVLSRDKQGWVAWLHGKGPHAIRLDAELAFSGSRNLPALVFGIPEAPVTTLDLSSQRDVDDVRLVPMVPITVRQTGDARSRIEAALGPRTKVDLRWRWRDSDRRETPPLIRADSQVTATIEPGVIQVRTELGLLVLRGTQTAIELRTSPSQRVLDVRRSDGTEVPWETYVQGEEQRIIVRFPEAITGRTELVVASQIPWFQETCTLRGLAVEGAFQNRSTLALRPAADTPDLDIAVTDLLNARRIGLESLPAPLRSPRNEGAFHAHAHPFHIKLSILPRRPSTSVRTTALVTFEGDHVTLVESWQFSVHGGKIPHLDFHLPEHFDVDQFVPTENVQAVRALPVEPDAGARLARVFLKGLPEKFEVRLRATVPAVEARGLIKSDLPWPRDVRAEWSRLFIAGPTHATMTPAAEFSPTDEVPDAVLAAEAQMNPSAVRAFQSRSPFDRLAVRLATEPTSARYSCGVLIRVEDNEAWVRQSFEYLPFGAPMRNRRFHIPDAVRKTVRLEAPGGHVRHDAATGDWDVQLDTRSTDPVLVQFSFRAPLTPESADSPASRLPLLHDVDGTVEATELTLVVPESSGIELVSDGWKRVAVNDTSLVKAESRVRQSFRRIGATDAVVLRRLAPSELLPTRALVQRALLQTVVGPDNEWHTHARYHVVTPAPGRMRLKIPAGGRITQVRWADRPLLARSSAHAGEVELADELAGPFPGVLEIECESVAPGTNGWWATMAWEAPVIVGDISWGRVLWELRLPDDVVAIRGSSRYSNENRLRWLGHTIGFAPRWDHETLGRWFTGSVRGDAAPGSNQAYLFSRLSSVESIGITVTRRLHLVLIASGTVLLFGIGLVVLPVRCRFYLIVAVLVGAGALYVIHPMAAVECARSAGLGVLIVMLAGIGQMWLARHGVQRRTVFPEAGVLAKSQGSAQRSSVEFALGSEPPRTSEPPTTSPRRIAQSSSVR